MRALIIDGPHEGMHEVSESVGNVLHFATPSSSALRPFTRQRYVRETPHPDDFLHGFEGSSYRHPAENVRTNPTPTLTSGDARYLYASWLRCAKWLRTVPPKQVAMAARTVTLEAHEIASRAGLHCHRCRQWAVTEVRCSIVDASTLAHQRYATGSLCLQCGDESD